MQWEGMGDVGSARYEPALLPPCPTIRVLSYSNCQRLDCLFVENVLIYFLCICYYFSNYVHHTVCIDLVACDKEIICIV